MKIRSLLAAPVFAGLLMVQTPSYAVCDGCVTNAVNVANAAIVSAIVAMQAKLLDGLYGVGRTLAAETAKTGELVAESAQKTESVAETNRQEARFELADACAAGAASNGTAQDAGRKVGGIGGGVGRGGRTAVPGVGLSGAMKEAIDTSKGQRPVPSPEEQTSRAAVGACATFAAGGSVRGETCVKAGMPVSAVNGHPDADIRAETLIDGPQKDTFRRKLTVDPDNAERTALEAYLRNLSTPIDLRQLAKGELKTTVGRQYMTFRDAYEARISMAEKPARSMAQNRLATLDLKPAIEQLLKSPVSAPFVQAYLARNAPNWSAKGISVDELANLEAERRYMNADWHIKMAALPPEAHVREQTDMMAYQIYLLNKIYERVDLQAVATGQIMGVAVRAEMLPQLLQLHAAATK